MSLAHCQTLFFCEHCTTDDSALKDTLLFQGAVQAQEGLHVKTQESYFVQVSPEDGSTPEPSQHPKASPLPTPPTSTHRSHLSFEDMLRQQLGQQVTCHCTT